MIVPYSSVVSDNSNNDNYRLQSCFLCLYKLVGNYNVIIHGMAGQERVAKTTLTVV